MTDFFEESHDEVYRVGAIFEGKVVIVRDHKGVYRGFATYNEAKAYLDEYNRIGAGMNHFIIKHTIDSKMEKVD